jgi:hypothetical protein
MEKTKGERLKESVTLLKKLPEAGIPTHHEVYVQINESLSNWVNSGIPSSQTIDLGTHLGELTLPVNKNETILFHIKAKKKI